MHQNLLSSSEIDINNHIFIKCLLCRSFDYRYEKNSSYDLSFVLLAAIFILLKCRIEAC